MGNLLQDLKFLTSLALFGTLLGFTLGSCAAKAVTTTGTGPQPAQMRRTVRVAVIDTGLAPSPETLPLCRATIDLTGTGPVDRTVTRHGTNVAGLIARTAAGTNFCITMFKVFDGKKASYPAYIRALALIAQGKYDVVNLSLSGTGYEKVEVLLLQRILNSGTVVIAAAGNARAYLGRTCNTYPACADPRITVVGAYDMAGSGWGPVVDVWGTGLNQCAGGVCLSGTSQATALHTGRVVNELGNK